MVKLEFSMYNISTLNYEKLDRINDFVCETRGILHVCI